MSTQQYQPGKMFGLTHAVDGQPIINLPRSLKVGIGLPAGTAVHGYMSRDEKLPFRVRVGSGKDATETAFASMEEARRAYWVAVKRGQKRKYPEKVGYFVFTRPAPDGNLYTDWKATAAHGPEPTEIGIVFTSNQPLRGAYQMWTAAELKCQGDGLSAERVLSMAATEEEKQLAVEAKARGARTFPIFGACRLMGCPFANCDKPACKPHTSLRFQLLTNPSLASEVTFDSTGYRTASWLSSALHTLRSLSSPTDPERGNVAWVPLKLFVRPYKTTHSGAPATAYGVSIDLTGDDVGKLRQQLIEAAQKFQAMSAPPLEQKLLAAGPEPSIPTADEDDFAAPSQRAASLHAEFYTEGAIDAEVVENGVKPLDELIPPTEAGPLYAAVISRGKTREWLDEQVAEGLAAGLALPEVLAKVREFAAWVPVEVPPGNPDAELPGDPPDESPASDPLDEDDQQKRQFEREQATAKGNGGLFDYKK